MEFVFSWCYVDADSRKPVQSRKSPFADPEDRGYPENAEIAKNKVSEKLRKTDPAAKKTRTKLGQNLKNVFILFFGSKS